MPISMKIRCYAVPVLLCVVATAHYVRHLAYQQSSWGAGCGFGMFATLDYHGTRFLRATLTSNGTRAPAGFRSRFPDLDLRTTVLPTQQNLQRYASALASQDWQLLTTPPLISVTTIGQRHPVDLCFALDDARRAAPTVRPDHVELAIWGVHFQPAERLVRAFPLRQVSLDASRDFEVTSQTVSSAQ